ncbi:hypothetical protein KM043_000390 [Ampulex compressa]|nr:hypothetical protein KM043_000390 [Ampulex compressa]
MREAKSELAVSETEKAAMRDQYRKSLDRRETEKRRLESEESQFIDLAATVRDLVREKTRLQSDLMGKQTELEALRSRIETKRESLEMEKLLRSKDLPRDNREKAHRASQTTERAFELTALVCNERDDGRMNALNGCTDHRFRSETREFGEVKGRTFVSNQRHNIRVKSKDDLDRASPEGTLIRDLFFRNPSVEESGSLDVIPVLSKTETQTRHSGSTPFV